MDGTTAAPAPGLGERRGKREPVRTGAPSSVRTRPARLGTARPAEATGGETRRASTDSGREPATLSSLLRAAQAEDPAAPQALETLLTQLHPMLIRFLAPNLRAWRDAADIVADVAQETLVRLAMGYSGCAATTDRAVRAWAFTVARHTLIDLLRSPSSGLMAREFSVCLDEVQAADVVDRDIPRHVTSHEADDATAPRTILLRLAVEVYNDAAAETGELLWWRLIMGAEWSDVAAELGTTAAGAKRRFQRAQATLERQLLERVASLPAAQRERVQALIGTLQVDAATQGMPSTAVAETRVVAATDHGASAHATHPEPVGRARVLASADPRRTTAGQHAA